MELHNCVKTEAQFDIAARAGFLAMTDDAPSPRVMTEERLPFSVSIVRDEEDLDKAVSIRHAAYGRHIPDVAALLETAEVYDSEPGSVVLLAQSKLDGSPLGTMRIQTNRYGKLALEETIELPSWLQGKGQAEATRLGVTSNRMGRLVKIALFKAYYQYCVMEDIEWMIITARAPLDRQYEALLFQDVVPGGGFIPMHHVGNIPHRVLAFNVVQADFNWRQAKHPLYNFVVNTSHPDIDLGGTDAKVFPDRYYASLASARNN
jgi:hypothetical protein